MGTLGGASAMLASSVSGTAPVASAASGYCAVPRFDDDAVKLELRSVEEARERRYDQEQEESSAQLSEIATALRRGAMSTDRSQGEQART